MLSTIVLLVQLLFTFIIGVYFLGMLKEKSVTKDAVKTQSKREMEKLTAANPFDKAAY